MSEVMYHRLRYFLSPQLDLYKRIARQLPAETVIDVGCGTGVGTLQLWDGNELVGVDIDEEALHFCDETWGNLATWTRPEHIHERFQLAVAIEVIEHVDEPRHFLRWMRDLVYPNGWVVISTINARGRYVKNHAHAREYDPADFLTLVQEAMPEAQLFDGTLEHHMYPDSNLTPMVALWRRPKP